MTTLTPPEGNTPGLSGLSRRSLLIGLASASTIAAGGSHAARAPVENPDLLRLAAELPALDAEHRDALSEERRIYRETMKIWPRAPKEIETLGGMWSDLERDVSGAGMRSAESKGLSRYIGTPKHFSNLKKFYQEDIDNPKQSKWRQKARPKLQANLVEAERGETLSEEYHSEIKRFREASGFEASTKRRKAAQDALKAHVAAIMDTPESTPHGVILKAQALAAWGAVDWFARSLSIEALPWPQQMAEAVLRQTGKLQEGGAS